MSKMPREFLRRKIDPADLLILREIPESGLHAGFASPAGDYEQQRINLTRQLVPHPDYTAIVSVHGDCCIDRGVIHIQRMCLL